MQTVLSSRTTTKAKSDYAMSDETKQPPRARLQKSKRQREDVERELREAMDGKWFAKRPTAQFLLIGQKQP